MPVGDESKERVEPHFSFLKQSGVLLSFDFFSFFLSFLDRGYRARDKVMKGLNPILLSRIRPQQGSARF